MSRAVRVQPAPGSQLEGDLARTVELDVAEPVDLRRVSVGADVAATPARPRTIEVVVDGWRFELTVEDAARAELRARATRDRDASKTSGPQEIRAMIPGRVAAVRVAAGDTVEAGASLLVVEAMKMQNELRAPRSGTVERVVVAAGDTIEVGDLLLVLA